MELEQKEVILDKLDELYLTIDTLSESELNNIIKYAEEQKTIVHFTEKRRQALANQLRIERIKIKKELNNIKLKQKNDIEDEEDIDMPVVKHNKPHKKKT